MSHRATTHDIFSIVSVREANTDRLVNEENIRILVPRIGVEGDVMNTIDPAGTCRG